MLLFQPDSHAATAIAPNPSLVLEMGSLPGITLGSLMSSPAWWGTQHPSPWNRGWAAKLSLTPEPAEKTYPSKNAFLLLQGAWAPGGLLHAARSSRESRLAPSLCSHRFVLLVHEHSGAHVGQGTLQQT